MKYQARVYIVAYIDNDVHVFVYIEYTKEYSTERREDPTGRFQVSVTAMGIHRSHKKFDTLLPTSSSCACINVCTNVCGSETRGASHFLSTLANAIEPRRVCGGGEHLPP